ncbi:hypothetical protein [Flavobacterium filum]|uniref:hypothetical protein n=1 Tax=Flavobacterium filum TaxID=370974 RepID=UPI000478F9C1|nr:hypothetical protein [Flavobacterium filum]
MANNTSQHNLGTAANLLGFCLFVITSLHISDKIESKLINQLTAIIAIVLTISCIFSFISIRSKKDKIEEKLETIANYLFLTSLIGILIIILLITFNLIN